MKVCIPSGTRPVKSAANHEMNTTHEDAIAYSESTIACGMTRISRKNTVRRDRSRS